MGKSYKDSHKWEQFARNYDVSISNKFESRIYKVENIIFYDFLKKYVDEEDKILDFACWTWRITSFIKKYYKNVVWYDISDDMLNIAKEKYPDIEFYNVDIQSENVSESFDIITAFRFFLNAEYSLKKDILNRFRCVLTWKSIVIFNIHMNSWCFTYFLSWIKRKLGFTKIIQNWMSYNDVDKLVKECWYKIIDSKWYSFLLWNPLLNWIPFNVLKKIDLWLSKSKFCKYFSKDIIYVIKKNNE